MDSSKAFSSHPDQHHHFPTQFFIARLSSLSCIQLFFFPIIIFKDILHPRPSSKMYSFTTILAASTLLATISASPIQQRSTCGRAPAGNGNQVPLSQPSGITTAQACQTQCDANTTCQSFVFGMVNNADQCILYSVPASSIPKQSRTNLVAYDKACTSVPAVVPTAANPTGANTGASKGKVVARDTCGSAPAGPGSQAPLSQPTGTTTAALCQAQCDANPACKSFVFGMVNNADECILYSVPASSIPKQSSPNLIAYDKTCASVPAVVPTAANPTGANIGKLAARDTCGAASAGTGSQTPLAQPSGITTAELCQGQCDANASCKSFLFGMVNNVDQCMLYSVAASAVPAQSSINLVAYDKACTSVPAVVPTASNPTGANTGSNTGASTGSNSGANPGAKAGSNTPTSSGQNQNLSARNTCGSTPTGTNTSTSKANPISAPSNINTAAACKAQCQADGSCKS